MEYVIPDAAAIHKIAITDMSAVKWVIAVINNPAGTSSSLDAPSIPPPTLGGDETLSSFSDTA